MILPPASASNPPADGYLPQIRCGKEQPIFVHFLESRFPSLRANLLHSKLVEVVHQEKRTFFIRINTIPSLVSWTPVAADFFRWRWRGNISIALLFFVLWADLWWTPCFTLYRICSCDIWNLGTFLLVIIWMRSSNSVF